MKSLKELCENIIFKKCSDSDYCYCNWLNCGFQCIPLKLYQDLMNKLFWYCECKIRKFTITNYSYNKTYKISSTPENCFYCWFTFLVKIKIKTIIKKKNNIVHLASELQKFFTFLNEFKYIYLTPNTIDKYEHYDYYETFNFYLDVNFGCFCVNDESSIHFL